MLRLVGLLPPCLRIAMVQNELANPARTALAGQVASNDKIVTVEGLGRGGKLTRLQQAFVDHTGSACGFCTPGMIITATALLESNRRPARRDIYRIEAACALVCSGCPQAPHGRFAASRSYETGETSHAENPCTHRSPANRRSPPPKNWLSVRATIRAFRRSRKWSVTTFGRRSPHPTRSFSIWRRSPRWRRSARV